MATKRRAGMVYGYNGSNLPVPAQAAGEELARIEEERGALRPAEVVDESRPAEAVLHPCFEWDDEAAAEKYREDQARRVIRSVKVVKVEPQGPREIRPAYISVVRADGNRAYVSSAKVMADEDMRRQALAEARSQLLAFRRRYGHLAEMAGVFDVIDQLPNS